MAVNILSLGGNLLGRALVARGLGSSFSARAVVFVDATQISVQAASWTWMRAAAASDTLIQLQIPPKTPTE